MASLIRRMVPALALVAVSAACVVQAADTASAPATPKFDTWLKDYIPAQFAGVKVADHHDWFQARIPSLNNLSISWSELTKDNITLGQVHGLKDGKSLFIANSAKEKWTDVASVVYYEGAGYFIPAYVNATMSDWKVSKCTVVQYDNADAKKFSEDMAKAWAKAQKP
jgi:hypothetical protein